MRAQRPQDKLLEGSVFVAPGVLSARLIRSAQPHCEPPGWNFMTLLDRMRYLENRQSSASNRAIRQRRPSALLALTRLRGLADSPACRTPTASTRRHFSQRSSVASVLRSSVHAVSASPPQTGRFGSGAGWASGTRRARARPDPANSGPRPPDGRRGRRPAAGLNARRPPTASAQLQGHSCARRQGFAPMLPEMLAHPCTPGPWPPGTEPRRDHPAGSRRPLWSLGSKRKSAVQSPSHPPSLNVSPLLKWDLSELSTHGFRAT